MAITIDASANTITGISNTIEEDDLKISNAGSDGQYLQKQSGNTGGLTWATVSTYTHPNHSGEITSSGDGATVIASNVVDEDNLKVSNSPTNGHFLSAQSGNTGGLTWAAAGGKILQYVYTSDNTLVQESTNTQLLDANITPASASNKILAISHCDCKATPNSLALACLNLYRGDSSGTLIQSSCGGVNAAHVHWTTLHHTVLDSPNTTSSQEYTLTIGRGSSSSSYADTNDNTYYLLLLEVAG